MNSKHIIGVFGVGLLLGVSTIAQEKKIKREDMPPAVQKTVAEQSKGASVRGFNEETENGQKTYEVEMLVKGHSKDVQMDAAGIVIEVEEEVEIAALSIEVRSGLQAAVGKGKITKVESITKKDKLVAYEAQFLIDGKRHEVQVGPDGKPLDHEE